MEKNNLGSEYGKILTTDRQTKNKVSPCKQKFTYLDEEVLGFGSSFAIAH